MSKVSKLNSGGYFSAYQFTDDCLRKKTILAKPENKRRFIRSPKVRRNRFKFVMVRTNKLTGKFNGCSESNTIRNRHFMCRFQTGSFTKGLFRNRINYFYGIVLNHIKHNLSNFVTLVAQFTVIRFKKVDNTHIDGNITRGRLIEQIFNLFGAFFVLYFALCYLLSGTSTEVLFFIYSGYGKQIHQRKTRFFFQGLS